MKAVCASEASESVYAMRSHEIVHPWEKIMDPPLGKNHCTLLVRKTKRANGILSKVRHYVLSEELLSIYYAIFSSHLVYGCQIWGQSINIFTHNVFKLQNRAVRILLFADFYANANAN